MIYQGYIFGNRIKGILQHMFGVSWVFEWWCRSDL